MSNQDIIRLCLALAVSILFHALLLGMQSSAIDVSKVDPAASNSQPLNVVLTEKSIHHPEVTREKAVSKRTENLVVRKIQKPLAADQQKTAPSDKAEEPVPKLSIPDKSIEIEKGSIQAIGAALQSMVSQQYMMMRLQQFFSMSRQSASGIIKNRFTQDKMTHYQGKRCTLRLLVAPVPGQSYEIAQPECDDPELAAELQAMPWSAAMPLPSEYSLPYMGLVIYLNVGSYDVSVGLEPIVAQSHNTVAPD